MAKVFVPNAPTCPECGNEMVWDEDEGMWYCLNCGYWEEEEEYFDDEEEELPECFGDAIGGYSEWCEVCEFREACEEMTKKNGEEEA